MGYDQFLSGTAIDPYRINQNFHDIRVGDFIPRGGESLLPTDGVNDLGATATSFTGMNFRDVVNDSLTSFTNQASVWNFATHFTLTATASSMEFSFAESSMGWNSTITTDMEIYMAGAAKFAGSATPLFFIIDQNSTASYFSNNTYWDTSSGKQLWATSTANSALGWGLGEVPNPILTMTSFLLKMNIRAYDGNAGGDFKVMGNWDLSFFQEDRVVQVCQGAGTFIDVGGLKYIKFNIGGLQPGSYVGIWRRK